MWITTLYVSQDNETWNFRDLLATFSATDQYEKTSNKGKLLETSLENPHALILLPDRNNSERLLTYQKTYGNSPNWLPKVRDLETFPTNPGLSIYALGWVIPANNTLSFKHTFYTPPPFYILYISARYCFFDIYDVSLIHYNQIFKIWK